jgi:hypothetical protein
MDDKAVSPVWSSNGSKWQLVTGALAAEIDVAHPHLGLQHTKLNHALANCSLFCTQRASRALPAHGGAATTLWPLNVAESYVRGNDLVASYSPSNEWPYSPQLYWQAASLASVDGVLASLSHLVSIQTHLLDTHPEIQVASQVSSAECIHLTMHDNGEADVEPARGGETLVPRGSICCILWRLAAVPASYIEIVATTDFHSVSLERGANHELYAVWHLFAEFLEKGVIRRARVHAALLPRENDLELALECCRAVEHVPLPLTT